jgi:hypothetical protein
MPTTRETILTAPRARHSTLPATALRWKVLGKGEPGEPEVPLSRA